MERQKLEALIKEMLKDPEIIAEAEEEKEGYEEKDMLKIRIRLYKQGRGILLFLEPLDPTIEIRRARVALTDIEFFEVKETVAE